jgi:hypothetical protein
MRRLWFALAAIAALLPPLGAVACAQGELLLAQNVEGRAAIINGDLPLADDECLTDAKVRALEQVLGVYIEQQIVVQQAIVLEAYLRSRAAGYVERFEIVKGPWTDALGLRRAIINAWVRPSAPEEIAKGAASEETVLLLTSGADEQQPARPVAAAVSSALLDADYRVLDSKYLQAPGSMATLQQALSGEPGAASSLGLRAMAGFVLQVHCDVAPESIYEGATAAQILTCVAHGAARLWRAGSPELLEGQQFEPVQARHTDAQTAANLAAAAFGQQAGKWAVEVIDTFSKRMERPITLQVNGLNTETEVEKMRNILGSLRWVTEVATETMQPPRATFTARIGGSTSSLAARLARLGFVRLNSFDDYTVSATAIPEKMGPPPEMGKPQLAPQPSTADLPPERARTRFVCTLVMPADRVDRSTWPAQGLALCSRAALEKVAAALEAPLDSAPAAVAEAMLSHAERYLREPSTVLEQSASGGRYFLRCSVDVDEARVRNRLYRVVKRARAPVAMVVLPEVVMSRPAPEPAAQTEIIRRLREAGFTVLDPPTFEEVQRSEEIRRVLEGNFDAATGVLMRGGAEVLIIGEAFAEEFRNPVTPQMPSARASVQVQVIRLGDATVAYALGEHASAVEVSPLAAGKKALQDCGAKVADKVMPWLLQPPTTPTTYELVVFGLSDSAQAGQIVNGLQGRIGVEEARLADYLAGAGQATITLSTFLSLQGMTQALAQGPVPLQVQTIRPGRLEAKIAP